MTIQQSTNRMCAPTLSSDRLVLRAMTLDDAKDVQRLAGDRNIAATTSLIPHPYPDGAAEAWISTHDSEFAVGKGAVWAVTLRDNGELIGAIGLTIDAESERAEMGYWIGVPYWGKGYMTEAARRTLKYAFEERRLTRVFAHHFHTNPASGRVMEKIGMKREGVLRRHYKKWGAFVDCVYFGVLREEYEAPGSS
jgi:[ribosomal protein S5]-alanine N-acetyltransferase